MKEFTGGKFYPRKETESVRNVEYDWGYNVPKYTEKTTFGLTIAYKKYLEKKRQEDREREIADMRNRLQYEYEHYGECDEIDFQCYLKMIGQ